LSAAIDRGHNLGIRVVAEGVENLATLRTLADASCDMAQGYHIAYPMDGAELRAWLRSNSGDAHSVDPDDVNATSQTPR
jgi:EAL domain-containing protein (putative c-di-GMP-specific phosphodiesterase class I)